MDDACRAREGHGGGGGEWRRHERRGLQLRAGGSAGPGASARARWLPRLLLPPGPRRGAPAARSQRPSSPAAAGHLAPAAAPGRARRAPMAWQCCTMDTMVRMAAAAAFSL